MKTKGFLYTLAAVLLLVPLVMLVTFYSNTEKTVSEDAIGKIRCDELHYFVEDLTRDMERATVIFGRRAAIYAGDDVIKSGRGLENYTYNNCTEFVFDGNGSEAAIAELIYCGTLYGENVTYMQNHTMLEWLDRIEYEGDVMRFSTEITPMDMKVVPYDAWDFAVLVDLKLNVEDESGMCFYKGSVVSTMSTTSIIGLEDPLYPLNTDSKVIKYINDCTPQIGFDTVMGCSKSYTGSGTCGGRVIFFSQIGGKGDLFTFCNTTDPNVLKETVLLVDGAFGGNCLADGNASLDLTSCFSASSSRHFSAVVDYSNSTTNLRGSCTVTIPWINYTGDLVGGNDRAPGCNESDAANNSCVLVRNIPDCDVYQVLEGMESSDVPVQCYVVSDVEELQNASTCAGSHPNGPSFFDRLDGNYNLSDKYKNQAITYFGSGAIGIETLVDEYELADKWVPVRSNATWVDYLYWQNVSGCDVAGVCRNDSYKFLLDCVHADKYNVDLCSSCGAGLGYNVPPTSNITSHANNGNFSCTSRLSGNASDCDGNVTMVEVGINWTWGEAAGTDSWNYSWQPQANCPYTICSRATDNRNGLQAPYDCINVTVIGCANTPPTSNITSHANLDNIGCTIINITGVASDSDPCDTIERVEVQVDGGAWTAANGTSLWNFSWQPEGNGWHQICSRANDSEGGIQNATTCINVRVSDCPCTIELVNGSVNQPSSHIVEFDIRNAGSYAQTIGEMNVTWNVSAAQLKRVWIPLGTDVWNGSANSGTIININDTAIGPGNQTSVKLEFTTGTNMKGANITVTFILEDGTVCSTIGFSAPGADETCGNCIDEDGDGLPDWADSDCSAFFRTAGCGEVHYCDPYDTDTCNNNCGNCSDNLDSMPLITGNSTNICNYYGYSTTEWHFYKFNASANGTLNVRFTGTAGVSGTNRTDFAFYDYTANVCNNPDRTWQLENTSHTFTVKQGKTYILALDVDACLNDCSNCTCGYWPACGCTKIGSYNLTTTLTPT